MLFRSILDTSHLGSFDSVHLSFGPNRFKTTSLSSLDVSSLKRNDVITLQLGAGEAVPAEVKALRKKGVGSNCGVKTPLARI